MVRRLSALSERILVFCALLPWWAWGGLALVTYFALDRLVGHDVTTILLSGDLERLAGHAQDQVLLSIGQYVLPLVLALIAVLSTRARHILPAASSIMTVSSRPRDLQAMSAQQFELLIGEAFRRKGYGIVEKGARGSRADLVVQKNGERCLVSLKQWRAIRVGANAVRELAETMEDKRVPRGMVVTTGVFTDDAVALARASRIDLHDGAALKALTRGVSVPSKVFRDPLSVLTRGTPYCPECQGRMVKKRVRDGAKAGKGYWRCFRYPDCQGRRPL